MPTQNDTSTHYYSDRMEQAVADTLNGHRVAGSGNGKFSAGDVLVGDDILIECKTSIKPVKSFSVKYDWLTKMKKEAFSINRYQSALCFDFEPGGDRYYVISEKEYKYLIENLK